jgi:hypothetical protein
MNRIIFTIILGVSSIGGPKMALAQADEKPVPKPPYIAPVPDYGHWTVTFKYFDIPANAAPGASSGSGTITPQLPNAPITPDDASPVSIDTIKTGGLRGIVLTFANGKSKQFTCQGNWVLISTDKGPQLGMANPTSSPFKFYTTGFILLDRVKIDPSTFRETAKHNGVLAFHYISGEVEVWINPASMLPLAVKQPGVEASYQFLNPPPRPFPIPKDQESLMQKEEQADQNTRSMR